MCDRQLRELFDQSPARTISAQRMKGAFDAKLQNELPDPGQEEWHQHLCSLQQAICELLIENQELRMSLLDSATSPQSAEANQ